MIRKLTFRATHRQNFLHERTSTQKENREGNQVVRPPTSHPYSALRANKSEIRLRNKYSPTYFLESKLEEPLNSTLKESNLNRSIARLSEAYRHNFDALRLFMKSSLSKRKFIEIDNVLQSLAKNVAELSNVKQVLLQELEHKNKVIKNLQQKVAELSLKTTTYGGDASKSCSSKRNRQITPQQILLQNCKLGELNARYVSIIAQLQSRKQVEQSVVACESREGQSKQDTEIIRCQNRIAYLEVKLSNSEKLEAQQALQVATLREEVEQHRVNIASLNSEYHAISERLNEWREKALMQKEDGETQIVRQQFLLFSIKKLRENNKNIYNRLVSQSQGDGARQQSVVSNPNFEYQLDFFKSLSAVYDKGKSKRLHTADEVKRNELGVEIAQATFDSDYQTYKKSDKFDISGLKYFRPSFFAFVEESMAHEKTLRNQQKNLVSRVFLQTLRAVMNSKSNEFLYLDCPEKFSRFPEFVYSWFQKFYFCSDKNSVLTLEQYMQKPINQETFYRELMSARLNQSWEIITFREFLLQELSLEQLYFYLTCQKLLFSKAGISKEVQYQGDFSILVDYSSAKTVLDLSLSDFETWNISFLTSKLREKIIMKNKVEMIDSGFYLRCLVEYYKIQRSNRYRYISKLCSEFKDFNNGLRFSSFMSIINKFTEMPMENKLKMYRQCYCVTKGIITAESIFIVCSENLAFLKCLKMKNLYLFPKIISKPMQRGASKSGYRLKQQQIACLKASYPSLSEIVIGFKEIIEQQNSLVSRAQSLGVSEFNNQINYMLHALDQRNTEIGRNILRDKHFIHYFMSMADKIRMVAFSNFYELMAEKSKSKSSGFRVEINEEELCAIFVSEIKLVYEIYRQSEEARTWKNKVHNFRVSHAAKKIQKAARKKIIEPHRKYSQYLSVKQESN